MAVELVSELLVQHQFFWTTVITDWQIIGYACSDDCVLGLAWGRTKAAVKKNLQQQVGEDIEFKSKLLPGLQKSLVRYFSERPTEFNVAVDISWASEFGQSVLLACSDIKPGTKITYGDLARLVGNPGAARAVGRVMAANRVPILIPCHRVVAASGRLGGYSGAGGLKSKEYLLQLEEKQL